MHTRIPSNKELSKFFVPVALQAMTQGITWQLVAMVASRGEGGPINVAGMGQSNAFVFFIATIGLGMYTAGMVYAKTKEGYEKYKKVNYFLMFMVGILHALSCVPAVSHLVFGRIMGLSPALETRAIQWLIASLPLQIIFFFRNPYQVTLLNARETRKAYFATLGRIASSLIMSFVFSKVGLVGLYWAAVCMTIPLIFEIILSAWLARPYIKELISDPLEITSKGEILRFNFTLSIGMFFLSLSAYLIGAFAARAPNPEKVLPVYYLTLGISNPVSFGALRLRTLIISYFGNTPVNRKLLKFCAMTGLVLGFLPFLFILPGPIRWYYIFLQNLTAADIPTIRITAIALFGLPFSVAIRAYFEGMASAIKKPTAILTGLAAFLGIAATASFISLNLGVPGNLIGPLALFSANLVATSIIALALNWEKKKDMPVPRTRLANLLR